MTTIETRPVIIAGGGPVGCIAALALAQQGIPVHLFEARDRVDSSPRAATIHASTLEMLGGLGLTNEITQNGLVEPLFRIWDRSSHRLVAQFDFGILQGDTPFPYAVQYEQHKLINLAIKRLRAFPHVKLEFSTPVISFEQFDDRVEVSIGGATGTTVVPGSYLIAADGTRSGVRKHLAIPFEGYTHPERFGILTTTFDFEGRFDGCARNWFSDPSEWCGLFKVSGEDGRGLWRLLFSARPDQRDADALETHEAERKLQRFFPKKGLYPIVHRTLYNVHQRVAATFRKGRVLLAGDAAHANNPLGGLGLNFGIHDAVELCALLSSIIRHRLTDDALDQYDARRRALSVTYLQAQTVANKALIEERDPRKREEDFHRLRNIASEKTAQRNFLLRASLIAAIRHQAT